jgi:hypothetical protein
MCENTVVRRVIKQGSGVPTIPVSTSHQNGDWIPTDVYEGEMYQDLNTGIVYTRNGNDIETVGGGAGNKLVWKGLISQTADTAPTAIVLENSTGVTASFSYVSPGVFTMTLTGALTSDKTFILTNAVTSCIFKAQRSNVNTIDLGSYDSTFTPTNALLDKVELSIEIYP